MFKNRFGSFSPFGRKWKQRGGGGAGPPSSCYFHVRFEAGNSRKFSKSFLRSSFVARKREEGEMARARFYLAVCVCVLKQETLADVQTLFLVFLLVWAETETVGWGSGAVPPSSRYFHVRLEARNARRFFKIVFEIIYVWAETEGRRSGAGPLLS